MRKITSGAIATSKWLKEQGISSKLAWWYVHSGWLERVGDGAYKRSGDKINWLAVMPALQNQLHLPVHVGAKTALQLLGQGHFLPVQGIKKIDLFTTPKTNLPKWMVDLIIPESFIIHKTNLFQKNNDQKLGLIEKNFDGVTTLLSSPERAILEILYLIPDKQSFDEASLLMESLNQLRPQVIQKLLETCNSIKTKRLFLYLADKFQHTWLSELNLKNIMLGRGKRKIGSGGDYDPKYQISVPKIIEQ